jgi:hypothetical protein
VANAGHRTGHQPWANSRTSGGIHVLGRCSNSRAMVTASHAARCVARHGVRSHPVPVEHDYSVTWSARSSSAGVIVMPRALAVLRLIANSNVVGCSTGRSAGLAPFRILST